MANRYQSTNVYRRSKPAIDDTSIANHLAGELSISWCNSTS
jgi:hypothetical protein